VTIIITNLTAKCHSNLLWH